MAVSTAMRDERWYADTMGWSLTAAGVVGAGVGGVLLLDAASLRDDVDHTSSQDEVNKLHDRADTRQLVGTISFVAGAGIAATGIVKLAVHGETPRTQALSWGIGASSRGAFVWGRF